jgi:hypothetical protein
MVGDVFCSRFCTAWGGRLRDDVRETSTVLSLLFLFSFLKQIETCGFGLWQTMLRFTAAFYVLSPVLLSTPASSSSLPLLSLRFLAT